MAVLPAIFVIIIFKLLLFFPQISYAIDTITQSKPLLDGTTLVSNDGTFELGFFTPGSSRNRYVGIWFKNIPPKTIIWVANRDNPVNNNSSKLTITKDGNLVLLSNNNNTVYWSTNSTTKAVNHVAQLLDSSNFVLRDETDANLDNYMWQSFDHPSDTLLPGMKLGWDLTTGLNRYITAWKNWDDPSSGDFTYRVTRRSVSETQLWNGSSILYRTGPWSGFRFSATPSLLRRSLVVVNFVDNMDENYYQFVPTNKSWILRTVVNQTLYTLNRYKWDEGSQEWKLDLVIPRDNCGHYNLCGSFGYCSINSNTNSSMCGCLDGFEPKSPQNWAGKDWSEGCVERSNSWRCKDKNKDGFVVFKNMKVPDTKTAWMNRSMTIEDCKANCWENCSCTAYANSDIAEDRSGYSGCIIWFGVLNDLRQFQDGGQDLYVRIDISQMDAKVGSKKVVVVVTSTVSSIIAMLVVFTFIYWRSKSNSRGKEINVAKAKINENEQEDVELPLFDFNTIACATNDFSSDNKLGQGGFGLVYRGTLPDGKDIAVKRLSDTSAQGVKEFKNEVIFCSKLQHRNLVKVLGYCIKQEEKLLIYEYMPNKSLNFFLFDTSQSKLLDWPRRLIIINGIARGLLYLHQDSRLRIIHRDLKTSNILLDNDLNPKIADFGLARMCRGDRIEGSTRRVIGTYGYMAPEYAINGAFSVKSDVYSFGILLLEVLSGQKNNRFSISSLNYNLVEHAWKCWTECRPLEFIDTCLGDSYTLSESLRCIQVGLLCVQHQPDDRPNMTSVVMMLTSECALPQPKKPVFLIATVPVEEDFGQNVNLSTGEVTVSELVPR